MAKGNGPISYNELFLSDVEKGLQELNVFAAQLDATFQSLATTVLNSKTRISISIKEQNGELKTVKANLEGVDVAARGAGETITKMGAAIDANTRKTTDLKNQQEGLRKIFDLSTASIDQIKERIKKLTSDYNAMSGATDKNNQSAQKLAQKIRDLKAIQDNLNNSLKVTRVVVEAAEGSYNAMSAKLAQLRKDLKEIPNSINQQTGEWNKANPAVKAYLTEINRLDTSLKRVDATLGNHQRNVGNYSGALNQAGGSIANLIGGYVSLYAAVALTGKIISSNAEISDSLSDIRRTAGLSADEADRLAESLKKIDTRTSLKGLLDIAVIGGQLGIAKDELAGFTKAVDELAIVLSNEIPGGAEAVATALGKINGVFKTQQKEGTNVEESLNKTGSAILKLGQVGLATGEFLQDFSLRVAGVSAQARISLPTVLAYSAVLEETGSSAEVAGTAFNRLVGSLASKREKFFAIAKIDDAKLTLKQFTDLINTDANAALQLFFKGLNKGGVNLTEFTDLLDTLKIKAGPAKNAIIALAQNQGLLNERIGEANKAYKDGTLTAEQFAIKNDTLAASIDKLKNSFINATSSGVIGRFFNELVKGLADVTTGFDKLFNSTSFKEVLLRLASFAPGGAAFGTAADSMRLQKSSPVDSALSAFKKLDQSGQSQLISSATYSRDRAFDIQEKTKTKSDIAFYNEQQKVLVALRLAYNNLYHAKKEVIDLTTTDQTETDAEKAKRQAEYLKSLEDQFNAIRYAIDSSGKVATAGQIKNLERLAKLIDGIKKDATDIDKKASTGIGSMGVNSPGIGLDNQGLSNNTPNLNSVNYAQSAAAYLSYKDLLDAYVSAERDGQTEITKIYSDEIQRRAKLHEDYVSLIRSSLDLIRSSNHLLGSEFGSLFDNLTTDLQNFLDGSGNNIQDWANTAVSVVNAVGASFKESSVARVEVLQAEKEQQLDLAGQNAIARENIEAAYNKRIRAEKRKQAQIDKVAASFEIAINTAVAVSKVAAQTGVVSPLLIPFIIALGAAQLALVATKPLPGYFKGREDGPAEFAMVNELGPEAIEHNGRLSIAAGGRKTATFLPAHAKVHTAEKTRDMMLIDENTALHGQLSRGLHQSRSQERIREMSIAFRQDPAAIGKAVREGVSTLPINMLNFDERGFSRAVKQGNTTTKYLNDRFSLK